MSMKRYLPVLLTAILALSVAYWALGVRAASPKVVAIDLTPGRVKDTESEPAQILLNYLIGNLTAAGYEVRKLTEITPETLKGVDALIIGKLRDYNSVFSDAEIAAIASWFKEGGKFLWVGADSDWVEPYLNPEDTSFKSDEPNRILEAIGSSLRFEAASLEDPIQNAGAAYRVVSYEANTAGFAGEITKNAFPVLFHGPSFIIGFKNGKYVPFSEVESDKCVWLYRSSPEGTVVSHDGVDPRAHAIGETGQFVEAAAEIISVGAFKPYSKVIATGESLLGDRNIMCTLYHGVELKGPTFVLNAFRWGLRVEKPMTIYYIVAALIIVIIVVVAVVVTRRR